MDQSPGNLDGIGHDSAFVNVSIGSDEVLFVNTDRSGLNAAYKLGIAGAECVGDFGVSHAVSDILVSGGEPFCLTIALLVPPETQIDFLEGVMIGANQAAKRYHAPIVAGDTKSNPSFAMVVTALGKGNVAERITRTNAKPGDFLVVTGYLGSMFIGLCAMKQGLDLAASERAIVHNAIIKQRPPERVGRIVAQSRIASAGTDISDGLPGAIFSICDASGYGAVLFEDLIPFDPRLKNTIDELGLLPLQMSAAGGDWEFLYAIPHEHMEELQKLPSMNETLMTVVGVITADPVSKIRTSDGNWRLLPRLINDSFSDSASSKSHFSRLRTTFAYDEQTLDIRSHESSWAALRDQIRQLTNAGKGK